MKGGGEEKGRRGKRKKGPRSERRDSRSRLLFRPCSIIDGEKSGGSVMYRLLSFEDIIDRFGACSFFFLSSILQLLRRFYPKIALRNFGYAG